MNDTTKTALKRTLAADRFEGSEDSTGLYL